MKMVWWSNGRMVGWSGGRTVAAFLAAVLGALGAVAGDEVPPGPENYLFKANVSDGGMIVFLPEAEIESREDAAAYLRWARETYPAQASRIVAKWASEDVNMAVFRSADAALLKAGDAVIDFGGKVSFRVAGPAENGKFRLHLASFPAFGEADPGLCLTNVWVLSRKGLLERWSKALAADPDGAPAEVKREIETISGGGRYGREGGEVWRATVEDFSTNTPALWPCVRFENRTSLPVSMWCQQATNTIAPGGEWRIAVKDPPADGEIKFYARRVPAAPYLEDDYGWSTNSIAWSRTASADAVHVFNELPGTLKPPPRLLLCVKTGADTKPMQMLPGLCATVEYKDGRTETVQATGTNDLPCVEIMPHVPMKAITLKADGYNDESLNWTVGKEPILGCGDYRSLPFPKPLSKEDRASSPSEPQKPAPARPEVSPHQETAPQGRVSSPSEPQKPALVRPVVSPHYDIKSWPGESIRPPPTPWPWENIERQQTRTQIWWGYYRDIKDDNDKNNALKRFNNLLEGKEDNWGVLFKKAYRHIASCKGCESCRVHREAMAAVPGFEDQRWVLFQSLLLNSGTDWREFIYPPTKDYIQNLRKLLSEWKSRKEKGK